MSIFNQDFWKGGDFLEQDKLQIDMKKTGAKIKALCKERHITVKDIQRELYISAHQSVYDWFSGKTLPSLDNMYRLSKLLQVHMEDMIEVNENPALEIKDGNYLMVYYQRLLEYSKKVQSQPE